MSNKSKFDIGQVSAFNSMDKTVLSELYKNSEKIVLDMGNPITIKNEISNKVYIITSGQARVLCNIKGKRSTFKKIGQGELIGLASILSISGCEDIIAASKIELIAFSDESILNLYLKDINFRDWCNSNIQTQEIQTISEKIHDNLLDSNKTIKEIFSSLSNNSKLVIKDDNSIFKDDEKYVYIASSGNIENISIGDELRKETIIKTRKNLPARIIGIDKKIYQEIIDGSLIVNRTESVEEKSITKQIKKEHTKSSLPEKTSIDFGQYTNEKKFTLIEAKGIAQETISTIQMLCLEMDLPFRKDTVERTVRDSIKDNKAPSFQVIGGILNSIGLHPTGVKVPSYASHRIITPAIIPWKESYALVKESNQKELIIASPSDGWVKISTDKIGEFFPDGITIIIAEKTNCSPNQKFNINWFLPSLKKNRGVLIQVFIASFIVQLFGLANPLLIQVIIDKVISQRSLDTLQILGVALVVVTILGGFIGSLRTFLFAETTNRIDTRLGAEVIDHLLRVPLNYFDKRPVGELSSRISELETIRNFLTGQAVTTILDAMFSIIYIVVMVFYSWLLALIALLVVPIQILLTLLGAPLFRKQIRNVAEENAKTQSHLVEVLTGVQTVKAQNIEIVSRWKWQDLYSKYISKSFEKTITGTALNQTSQVLQQLSQLLVLWVGATLVLQGKLSLGQLIAFRIISGYVTQPLLRLSTIWQNIQQLKVSFERLADIIDTPEESSEEDKLNIPLPKISGKVSFQNINFSFLKGSENVLSNVNLDVPAGKFVGVVGQSGSGKSTLMKLIPRLYSPDKGKILIDGYDISKVELYSLRRQIGIVPQEPLLFSGKISENISISEPDASSEDIVRAAKSANAHDFIMTLPYGYSTKVGERGSGLSGGQKQRIAIARTLLNKPKMLILDEATSALDYDTEKKVCDNIAKEYRNSTIFFITHRLSTIKNADIIVYLNNGIIEEIGTHNQLIDLKGRYYALYKQQEGE
mgnify:CR=1 FL=1